MTVDKVRQRLSDLRQRPISRQLLRAAVPVSCHLVGGALRDTALGETIRDLDAVVEQRGHIIAERLAANTSGRLVVLGGDRFAAYRVVLPEMTVDLWDRQGASLESDLLRRDLTVNSFALDLSTGDLSDPADGLTDLRNRLLRATGTKVFADDPLRALRLARLAGQLPKFSVEPATISLARQVAPDVARLAAERVRQELDLLLRTAGADHWLNVLAELALYPQLWTGRSGSAERARQAFAALADLGDRIGEISPSLSVDLPDARGALLFDCLPRSGENGQKSSLESFADRGLISRRVTRRIGRLLEWRQIPRSQGEQRWFLHRTGDCWPTAICFLGARPENEQDPAGWTRIVEELLHLETTAGDEIFDPGPLLDVREVQRLLERPPGPQVGTILRLLRRRQIEGVIRTRSEAERFVRQTQKAELQGGDSTSSSW